MSQPVSKSASALGGGVVVQKQKAGVYTVLLVLSLVAILIGCALLYAVIQNRYGGELTPSGVSQAQSATPAVHAAGIAVQHSEADALLL